MAENEGTPLFRGGKRPTLGTRSGARAPLPWSPSPRPRADLRSSPAPPPAQTCTICFCDAPAAEGISCAEAHYTCGECFESYVKSEIEKPVGEVRKRDPEGRCLCPRNTASAGADRCVARPFADKDVAARLTHDTFERYLRSRAAIRETAVADEMRAEMERRVDVEKRRAEAAASEAGAEERLRNAKEHIVERVLTLCCPRCTQAFVDFDGCFALNCGRCRAAFCAYCLADCGRDAHAHVGSCAEGKDSLKASGGSARRIGGHPATVYGTKAMFEVAQKRRRCKHLALYLERFDDKTRADVVRAVETELRDLGIAPADVARSADKHTKDVAKADKAAAAQRARQGQRGGGRGAPAGGARGVGGGGGDGGVARGRAAMGRAMELAAAMLARDGAGGVGVRVGVGVRGFDPPGFGPGGVLLVDPLQELLDAGIPGPGFGRLPGENAPGELGPLRRERAEKKRKQREQAEHAARDARAARRAGAARAAPAVENVDLVGAGASGGGAGGAGGACRRASREKNASAPAAAIDLVASQDDAVPTSPSANARGRQRCPAGGEGGDEVVDLT